MVSVILDRVLINKMLGRIIWENIVMKYLFILNDLLNSCWCFVNWSLINYVISLFLRRKYEVV